MAGPSKTKSVEDLENQLILKNKDLNEKYLELETLLDLTNTINSLNTINTITLLLETIFIVVVMIFYLLSMTSSLIVVA